MSLALPTVHGLLFLLAAAVSLGVAIINVGLASALVASFLCGFSLAGFLLAQFALYGVTVRREKMEDSCCGALADLSLEIVNHAPFSRMAMVITEKSRLFPDGVLYTAVPSLRRNECFLLSRGVQLAVRGAFHLDKLTLSGGDPAGLFRRKKVFSLPGDILVAPKTEPLYTFPHLLQNRRVTPGQEGRPLSLAGTGRDFFGIRPFRHGDELRFVHWRSTAAKGELMVKEMEAQTLDNVAVFLDVSSADTGISVPESNLEFQIRCAASILEYLSNIHCHFSFYCQKEGEFVEIHGNVEKIRKKVMDLLTVIQPEKEDFCNFISSIRTQIEPGTILFVLSLSCPEKLAQQLALLQEARIFVHWIYAPRELFPHIDEETPLVLDPSRVSLPASCPVEPALVSRISDINKVMEEC